MGSEDREKLKWQPSSGLEGRRARKRRITLEACQSRSQTIKGSLGGWQQECTPTSPFLTSRSRSSVCPVLALGSGYGAPHGKVLSARRHLPKQSSNPVGSCPIWFRSGSLGFGRPQHLSANGRGAKHSIKPRVMISCIGVWYGYLQSNVPCNTHPTNTSTTTTTTTGLAPPTLF